ncbi:solute carrier family 26 member 6-like [Oppia nitens]|uniref:solute carrier family 26 member 6-like n=1 Tax=Oppia nitens TaxID=1686743 RepID=UPI0023DBFA02|nr:solute carrier family 26 member 6-like [Oppia nitens]
MAYSLPNFNARFRRSSQIPGARPKSMTSERVLEKVKPQCKSPVDMLKGWFPAIGWLSKYNRQDLVPDVVSGATIAVFQVPESMGYSLLAQVKPVYCLYSSFFPILIYSLMGTSRHCSVGTFAALAIMTGAIINQVREGYDEHNVMLSSHTMAFIRNASEISSSATGAPEQYRYTKEEIAIVCSFIIGCYQLIFGFLRLGFVSVYMSEQFLNGFTCAVAFHVVGSQFQHMFGLETKPVNGVFTLAKEIAAVVANIADTNLASLILSIICTVILLAFKLYVNKLIAKKFNIKVPFPIEIFIVIGSVIVSNLMQLESNYGVKVVGHIDRGLPTPAAPWNYWPLFRRVWLPCIPLSVVSYAITYSVGKSFAIKHDYEIDSSQELIALGGSNLFSSFFRCIPVGASLSRSAVQEGSGGRTQLVSLINCVGICAVLLYFGSFLEQLPDSVLATIISVALRAMLLEIRLFKNYWDVSKIDGSIWLVTFLSVIILDIDYGLYIGLIWSLITLIYKSQRPRNYLLGTVGDQMDVFVPLGKYVNAREVPGIKIYQFCGPLHFANVDYFTEGLVQKIGFSPKEIKEKMAKLEKSHKRLSDINTIGKPTTTTTGADTTTDTITLRHMKTRHSYNMNTADTHHHHHHHHHSYELPELPTHMIIDCSMFSYIDTDGIKTLKRTIADFGYIGLKTLLGGCPSHVTKQLERDHFYAAVPAHHIYISIYDALQYALQQREQQPPQHVVLATLHEVESDGEPVADSVVKTNQGTVANGVQNRGYIGGGGGGGGGGGVGGRSYDSFDEIRIDFEPQFDKKISFQSNGL